MFDPIPTQDYYSLYGVFASSGAEERPLAAALIDALEPHNARVFIRGNPGNPGEEARGGFSRLLAGKDRKPFQHGSGRLELAQAIVDPKNPLTARTIVNRVWGHLFGNGLVRTPSDFGARPIRPATRNCSTTWAQFVNQGWSVKKLIRQVVLSRTYQQQSNDRPECSQADPENRLLWKMNRRRLDFESLRDAILSVAGSWTPRWAGLRSHWTPRRTPTGERCMPLSTARTCPAFSAHSISPVRTRTARSGTIQRCRNRRCI